MIVLLDDVGAPSGDARERKDRGVQSGGETHETEHDGGVEVDIRAEVLFASHHFFELFADGRATAVFRLVRSPSWRASSRIAGTRESPVR